MSLIHFVSPKIFCTGFVNLYMKYTNTIPTKSDMECDTRMLLNEH